MKLFIMANLLGWMICASCWGNGYGEIDTSTVKQLNLKHFMGKWYEIARYEHRFEKGMTHVTAEYSIRPDGKIKVVNRGIKDSTSSSGVALFVSKERTAFSFS